jgi:hypothetical protein
MYYQSMIFNEARFVSIESEDCQNFCQDRTKFLSRRKKNSIEEKIFGCRGEKKFLSKRKFSAVEEKNFRLSKRKFRGVI